MTKFQLPVLKGEENYQVWEIQMRSYLTLAEFLHCIFSEPTDIVVVVEEQQQQEPIVVPTTIQDAKALATLRLCCESGPLRSITTVKTAKEAWLALKESYAPEAYSTKQLYISELLDIDPNNFEDMEAFVDRVRFLTQQLPEFGVTISEEVTIELVRKRLPERFNVFSQTLLAQLRRNKASYTLKELLNEILDEDRKTKADSTPLIQANVVQQNKAGKSSSKPWKKTKG